MTYEQIPCDSGICRLSQELEPMYDCRRHITGVVIVIESDSIAMVTYYHPQTKVGMALTEEALVHAATELSLDYDTQLEVLREGVDNVTGR